MQSIIKKIVWVSLCIIPFLALYIANGNGLDLLNRGTVGMFFPFISGKNIVFRVLVEIAFAGWIILALRNHTYRISIKKSPLTIAYIIFIIILLLADLFGADPKNSMWSNFERMEGFVGHVHFFLYFFVLTAMLHTLKEWQTMLKVFLAGNVAVLTYGYAQLMGAPLYIFSENLPAKVVTWFATTFPVHQGGNRLDATIGNSAYYAIFCLMSAFIAGILWSQLSNPKSARFYPILIVLNLIAIFYSGTRGTMIGVMVGLLVTLVIIATKEKGKPRKIFFGVFTGLILALVLLFASKNTEFVKSSSQLYRFASISPTDLTGGSRIAIWKVSYDAFLERPILGYGQDNFSYIYARKFNAEKMWNLEPWYDRSHDVFFDWLIAGGILGLISYLSLYVVSLWLMWRKESLMPFREKAIITGAFAGYFVHNIFVFDNLTSYILFFALLAYIVIRTGGDRLFAQSGVGASEENIKLLYAPIVAIVLFASLYYINYRPLTVNRLMIKAMDVNSLMQTMPFAEAVKVQQESFIKAIGLDTLGSTEAREQFLQMGVRLVQVNIPQDMPESERQLSFQAVDSFVKAVRADVLASYESYKDNVRMLSIYGMFYNGIGDPASGEKVLTEAHTLAPNKQLISFDLIRSYLGQRKFAEAHALARTTYESQPLFPDAQKLYLLTSAYTGGFKQIRNELASKGHNLQLDADILNAVVNSGQITLGLELLNELKKQSPQYEAEINEYIKKLLASPKK